MSKELEQALEDLSLLKDIEMVVAPLKPTSYMQKIGSCAGGVNQKTAKIIYESMVAASVFDPTQNGLH